MTFEEYLRSIGLGSGRGAAHEDAVAGARVNYDRMMASGDYGTNIGGIVPGTQMPTAPVTIDGQQWMRAGVSPETITEQRLSGMLSPDAYRYDERYGDLIRPDAAAALNQRAAQIAAQDKQGGLTNKIQGAFDNGAGVFALGGLGMGAALGGAFPGFDAISGTGIPAGQTSILSQFGMNNPFSSLSDYIGGDGGADFGGWSADDFTTGIPDADFGMDFSGDGFNIPGGQAELDAFMNGLGAEMLNPVGSSGAFFPSGAAGWNALLKAAGTAGSVASKAAGTGGKSLTDYLTDPRTLLGGAGALGSALLQAGAIDKAVSAQTDAANRATDATLKMYEQNRTDLEPWRTAGGGAVKRLSDMLTPGFQASALEMDPGYQFRLDEGSKALERSAAARGGLFSGNTGKAITQYGQNFASNEFGNATNRLANLAGLGQTSANSTALLGQNAATQAGNNAIGAGNARASGYIGGANAVGGSLSSFLRNMQENEMLDLLRARGGF